MGGILVHAFCFLYGKTGDAPLLDAALRLARYSFANRDARTDLLINNPTQTRWDGHVATTEGGHWARALLAAAGTLEKSAVGGAAGVAGAAELRMIAGRALTAYLRHGYDASNGRYFGRLNLDGTPDLGPRETPYMPGDHSSIWEFLFPTHDYPMAMGMAALEGIERRDRGPASSGGAPESLFVDGARRLADAAVAEAMTRPAGQVRYAENYARAVVYLAECARILDHEPYRRAAEDLAAEALRDFDRGSLMVGRTGADWYDAIDGGGYFMLALLYLETADPDLLMMF